jgi:hypothetical protein
MAFHWRNVVWPRPADSTVFELRVRRGLRKRSVFLVLVEGRLFLCLDRPQSWLMPEPPSWSWFRSPRDLGRLADLPSESSSLFAICERLQEEGWSDGRNARVAQQIVDKIASLATERKQRLLALPPAARIRWDAMAREDQSDPAVSRIARWAAFRQGVIETTGGSLDVWLYYQWAPLVGGSPSARWGVHRAKTVGSARPLSTDGRVPLGDVCCDQTVGDLEDWGWPRSEALSIGRALAEQGFSDWMELEPERARAWQDDGRRPEASSEQDQRPKTDD